MRVNAKENIVKLRVNEQEIIKFQFNYTCKGPEE